MSYDDKKDTVIGYVEQEKGDTSARFKVLGYRNAENEFSSNTSYFKPHGKVFCPSFFKSESFPKTIKNQKTVYEFSCISSTSYDPNLDWDYYYVDIRKPMNPLPRLIKVGWTENDIGLNEKRFLNALSIEGAWQAYPYNPIENILFEEVKFIDGVFSPVKGKEIQGYSVPEESFIRFKIPSIKSIEYFLPNLQRTIFKGKPKAVIDFMTISQLKDWLKEKIRTHSNLDMGSLQKVNELVNKLPTDIDILDQKRLSRARNYLESITLTDENLQLLLTSDSSIGRELKAQLDSLKKEYEAEWKESLQTSFNIEISDHEKKRSTFRTEIESLEKAKTEVLNKKQLKEKELRTLDDDLKVKTEEVQKIETHKELIFSTVQALASVKSSEKGSNGAPAYSNETTKMAKLFTVEGRMPFDPSSAQSIQSELFGIEDFLITSLRKTTKVSYPEAKSVVDVLKHKASFIPSVSWAYALAYLVGNSNVMNLTVEYDWLHHADFSKYGLQAYWERAHENPEEIHFLVLQNINIVPSECSLLPLLEVLSGVRPVLEGTNLGVPSNLYCLATVVTTKGDHAMGVALKPDLFQSWGAFLKPNSSIFTTYTSLNELDRGVTCEQLKDATFRMLDIQQLQTSSSAKELYYGF